MALSTNINRWHLGEGSRYKKLQEQQAGQQASGFHSEWSDRIEDLYNQIEGRKFSYNQQDDPLYQQYRSMYEQNAKLAMQDTVGQVSALTGGYASSYAQTAGQAVYNQQMGQMNEKALELRTAALQEYQMEGDKLMQLYGISGDSYNRDYAQHRDSVADSHWAAEFAENQRQFNENLAWEKQNAAANRASSRASSIYNNVYSGAYRRAASSSQGLTPSEQLARDKFEYQKERDAISDEQYADKLAYQYAALYAKGSGGSNKSSKRSGNGKGSGNDEPKPAPLTAADRKTVDQAEASMMTPQEFSRRRAANKRKNGEGAVTVNQQKTTTYEDYVMEEIYRKQSNGELTAAQAQLMMDHYYQNYGK